MLKHGSKLTLPAIMLILSACSPASFTGSPVDADLKKPVQYRVMQSKCSSLQLRDSELGKGISAHDFRALLSCFNSKGDLDPVEKVTQELSDSELEVVLLPMNRSLLGSADNFNSIQKGYELLSKWGFLDNGFKSVSEVARHPKLIRSGAEILMASGKPDATYRTALQLLSSRFTTEGTKSFSGAVLAVIQSPAWKELVQSLQKPSDDVRATAENQALSVRRYLLEKNKNPKTNIFQKLLEGLADQSLFKVTDQMLGKDLAEIKEGISEVSSVMNWSFKEQKQGRYIDQALELFRFADRPVECFKKAVRIEDPITFFVGEVSRQSKESVKHYLQVETPQNLVGVVPFCDLPQGFNQKYQNFLRISYLPQLERAHSCIIQSFYRSGRFDLLRSFLVDPHSIELLPSLSRLNTDRSWEDLFLVMSSIRIEDRASVADTALFLSRARSELGGLSIFEVLSARWAAADEKYWVDVFSEFASLGAAQSNTLERVLQTARALQFASGENPLVSCLKFILQTPELTEKWFAAAVKLERSEHYSNALSLLSTMAVDGRLQEIIDQTLRLFSRLSNQATMKIDENKTLPNFDLNEWLRHTWSSKDLPVLSEKEESSDQNQCYGVDIEFNVFDSHSDQYEEKFEKLKKCLGSKWATIFESLHRAKTSNSNDYFSLASQTLSRFQGTTSELQDFLNRWTGLERSGEFESLLKIVPVFSNVPQFKESLTQVLSRATEMKGGALRDILAKAGVVARKVDRKSLSAALKNVFKNYDSYEFAPTVTAPLSLSAEKTRKGVAEQECIKDAALLEKRVKEILNETQFSIATPELVNGSPRMGWKTGELKETVQDVLKNMDEPLFKAVLSFIRLFGLKENEAANVEKRYYPKDLFQWLKERSNDYKMISYYYPGEKKPRVRWVNSIDAFELLVANVDFNFITKDNYGMKFFGEIAQAYGDEPEEMWPDEVLAEFKRTGKRPLTTAEVYAKIEKMLGTIEALVGYPKLPKCGESLDDDVFETTPPRAQPKFPVAHFVPRYVRAAIFNLKQLLPVIRENIVGSRHAHDGGIRVIRDLFYLLRSTTPEKDRSPKAGDANHLSIVPKIVKLGALHEVAKLVREVKEGDVEAVRFIEGLVYSVSSPEIYKGLKKVLVDDLRHEFVNSALDLADELVAQNKLSELGKFFYYAVSSVQNLELRDEFARELGITLERFDQLLAKNILRLRDVVTHTELIRFFATLSQLNDSEGRVSLSSQVKEFLFQTGLARETLDFSVEILTDQSVSHSIDVLSEAIESATHSPEYDNLNLKVWRDRAVNFLGEEGLAQRVTEFAADILDSGDIFEWLKFAARDPNGFESLLDAVSKAISEGRAAEFFGLVQRAIDTH